MRWLGASSKLVQHDLNLESKLFGDPMCHGWVKTREIGCYGHPSGSGNPYHSLPWVPDKGVMTIPECNLNLPKLQRQEWAQYTLYIPVSNATLCSLFWCMAMPGDTNPVESKRPPAGSSVRPLMPWPPEALLRIQQRSVDVPGWIASLAVIRTSMLRSFIAVSGWVSGCLRSRNGNALILTIWQYLVLVCSVSLKKVIVKLTYTDLHQKIECLLLHLPFEG